MMILLKFISEMLARVQYVLVFWALCFVCPDNTAIDLAQTLSNISVHLF